MILALFYVIFTNINVGELDWLVLVNGLCFIMIGLGLIVINRTIVTAVKERSMEGMQASAALPVDEDVPVDIVTPSGTVSHTHPTRSVRGGSPARSTSPADDDIKIQIRMPVGDSEPARRQPTPSSKRKEMKVGCPRCNGVITLDRSEPISKIRCPFCGFEGSVG